MKPDLSPPVPVRLPVDVLSEIEAIAKTCDRTRSWVIVRALRLYLAAEGADILAVSRGLEQAAAGDLHDMAEALREIERVVKGEAA